MTRSSWLAVALAIVCVGTSSGQAVFQPPVAFDSLYDWPARPLAGDVTGDGLPDVLLGGHGFMGSDKIALLVNNGDGTVAAPVLLDLGTPNLRALADLNGDGLLDLVCVRRTCSGFFCFESNVHIFLGKGHGSFVSGAQVVMPSLAYDVWVGDVTGDGAPDLVTLNSKAPLPESQVDVYPGIGDGTFLDPILLFDQDSLKASGLGLGDLNRDGIDDVVATGLDSTGQHVVRVLLATGGGSFAGPSDIKLGPETEKVGPVLLADFNGDGLLDIAAAFLPQWNNSMSVWLGYGNGTFDIAVSSKLGDRFEGWVATDLDGDDVLDLAVGDSITNDVQVFKGLGDGSFSPAVKVTIGNSPSELVALDFDGDGAADLGVPGGLAPSYPDVAAFLVILNHTYGPEEACSDEGWALKGGAGWPIQNVIGPIQTDEPVTFRLAAAAPDTTAWLVIGLHALYTPLAGGALVPSPDLLVGPFALGSAAGVDVAGTWPPGIPSQLRLWVQFWIKDPGAEQGWAASSALRVVTP